MSLFKPKQSLIPSWWTHWQSLFLHFQLRDWQINLSLLYFADTSTGYCSFYLHSETILNNSSSPFLYLLHFQGISENFTPWFLSVRCNNPNGNFSFFYPISLLLIDTLQILQNLCLLTLIFDAQFSLATYSTHPFYFQQTTFHLGNFSG